MRHTKIQIASLLLVLATAATVTAGEILLTIPRPAEVTYSTTYFGHSVAAIGDHNGDGYADFLVGQPDVIGHAFLYYGGPALDAQHDLMIGDLPILSQMGRTLTGLGDFNADGHPDFAVGQPRGSDYSGYPSQVHVFFGGPALDAETDLALRRPSMVSWIGTALHGGVDWNADGHPDLVAAAPNDSTGANERGRVFVYFGGPDVDDEPDVFIDGPDLAYHPGIDVKFVPDVTGDEYPDLAVIFEYPHGVYVYAGGPDADGEPEMYHHLGTPEYQLYPYNFNRVLPRLAGGDLDGDGQAELVVSAPWWDDGRGRVEVLQLDASDQLTVAATFVGRWSGTGLGCSLDLSGDLDGDGIVDLTVGEVGYGRDSIRGYLHVYPGGDLAALEKSLIMTADLGTGRFGRAAASIGDLDGDGDDELVVGGMSPYGHAWIADEFFYDCDDDGVPDLDLVDQGLIEDCDDNRIPDSCQLYLYAIEDCDEDGALDACAITADPSLDCNGDGVLDACQVANLTLDCNEDGILDSCQLAADPGLDCDGDGQIDYCQIRYDTDLDCNDDWLLDSCQFAADPATDCDSDGAFDGCQIADDPALDTDGDGALDYCRHPGRLALYADPEFTHSDLAAAAAGVVGPFYLVLEVPLDAPPVTNVELELLLTNGLAAAIVIPEPDLISVDGDDRNEGLLLFFDAQEPDADGRLLLGRVWVSLTDVSGPGEEIRILANTSREATPGFDTPIWSDSTPQAMLVTETTHGFINGGLTDAPLPESTLHLAIGNHPNPFNPMTTIRMELPSAGPALLDIVDLSGRVVFRQAFVADAAGPRDAVWRGRDGSGRRVASGVYLARLTQGAAEVRTKLVLLK